MSVYGSAFSGGYKQSPMAQALANAGANLGSGIEKGVAGYVDGRQKQDALALEREKMGAQRASEQAAQKRAVGAKAADFYRDNPGDPDKAFAQFDAYAQSQGFKGSDFEQYNPTAGQQPVTPQPPAPMATPAPTGLGKVTQGNARFSVMGSDSPNAQPIESGPRPTVGTAINNPHAAQPQARNLSVLTGNPKTEAERSLAKQQMPNPEDGGKMWDVAVDPRTFQPVKWLNPVQPGAGKDPNKTEVPIDGVMHTVTLAPDNQTIVKDWGPTPTKGETSLESNKFSLALSDKWFAQSDDYIGAKQAYNNVLAAAEDPSPAGDIALIFAFMKTLDPRSTVREGEFATAENAGSIDESVRNKYNKVIAGERLGATRQDFVNQSKKAFMRKRKQQEIVNARWERTAKAYGVNPALVVDRGEMELPTGEIAAQGPVIAGQGAVK